MLEQDSTCDKPTSNCNDCSLSRYCLPGGLDQSDIDKLGQMYKVQRLVTKGDLLFREGTDFKNLYILRSGSLQTSVSDLYHNLQVTGFYFKGDVLGLDAIASQQYQSTAVALEISSICVIPFSELLNVAAELPTLQKQLFSILSKQLNDKSETSQNISAEQRLCIFLLGISERLKAQKLSPTEFNLTMTRQDLSNYLGLAPETLSRLFTRLQKQDVIAVERKHIHLKNVRALQVLSCCPE